MCIDYPIQHHPKPMIHPKPIPICNDSPSWNHLRTIVIADPWILRIRWRHLQYFTYKSELGSEPYTCTYAEIQWAHAIVPWNYKCWRTECLGKQEVTRTRKGTERPQRLLVAPEYAECTRWVRGIGPGWLLARRWQGEAPQVASPLTSICSSLSCAFLVYASSHFKLTMPEKHNTNSDARQSLGLPYGTLMSLKGV